MYCASIIIPVYNAERTLRKCVESLCYGKEKNIEIILVDDCSKDDSWNICKILQDEYQNVKCYKNERNRGVSYTRNFGLSKATAPYILFVDSDDWISSRYVSTMLLLVNEREDCLPVCGYTYIDQLTNSRSINCYSEERVDVINISELVLLYNNVLLQQLWNKIFRRDLIEKYQIRFDETQSMGEDFQFVLDYLKATQIKKFIIFNEPLYYYIRWNISSLMSQFGFIDNRMEFARIEEMMEITESSIESEKVLIIDQMKMNYVYHIVRNKTHSKQDKLEAIERIMRDGKASVYYNSQKPQVLKEQMASFLCKSKQLILRTNGRIQRYRLQKKICKSLHNVNADGITFISQNCIGGVLYHDLGLQFLSPTVNVFIPEPGFMKMVLNLRYYMEKELEISWGDEYPIGKLEDVVIHFMHYDTCKEAKDAWDKRKARIKWDKIFVIGTDRDGFNYKDYEKWKQISYPKILFTTNPEYIEDSLCFPEYINDGQIGDLISERKFYQNKILVNKINEYR